MTFTDPDYLKPTEQLQTSGKDGSKEIGEKTRMSGRAKSSVATNVRERTTVSPAIWRQFAVGPAARCMAG